MFSRKKNQKSEKYKTTKSDEIYIANPKYVK